MPKNNSDALCHYDILGMKWGVRRTPEQLGYARTIKAGTKFYRQTTNPNESKSGSKYVSYADPDRDYYKGKAKNFILNNSKNKSNDIYEVQYKAVKDIVAPSVKMTTAGIKAINKKYPKDSLAAMSKSAVYLRSDYFITKYTDAWMEKHHLRDYANKEEYDKTYNEYKKIIKPKADKDCIKDFTNSYSNNKLTDKDLLFYSALGINFDSKYRKLVKDHFEKAGYNAVTDIAGIGLYSREGYDPLIVLNTEATLAEVSKHKVSDIESSKATTKYEKWANKNRKYGLDNTLNAD